MTTILGIWAHPDDEVFVSGGLMADAVRRGDRVVCIHMTRGEAGLSYRHRCPPETLASIRQRELEASLVRLGVEEQRFFGYPDGRLAEVNSEEAIALIHDVFMELQPDVILTFGPDGFTGHPDHKSLSAWVTSALDRWSKRQTRVYHAAVSHDWKDSFAAPLSEFDFFWPGHPILSPHSDVTLNLDDELLATKVEALREHASQMKPLFDAYGDEFMHAIAATEHFRLGSTHPSCSNRHRMFSANTSPGQSYSGRNTRPAPPRDPRPHDCAHS
jgi:LmbE family N-acetylglucosaminyl deacetylase